MIDQFLTI